MPKRRTVSTQLTETDWERILSLEPTPQCNIPIRRIKLWARHFQESGNKPILGMNLCHSSGRIETANAILRKQGLPYRLRRATSRKIWWERYYQFVIVEP